jgi:ubiquinone/menaquinone biosynthesis C-methylase UbiE
MIDFDSINQGFSREAQFYDADDEQNEINRWARSLVRKTVTHYVSSGSSILEINAGTGADALWLANNGYRIHATDIADGMLAAIHSKIQDSSVADRITIQKLSFTELEQATNAPFDGVFSNFGGLNCTPDLSRVAGGIRHVLKPGGYVICVVMPPFCPWELAQLLRGHWRNATRRFQSGGVLANVRGAHIMTYYFTPRQVHRALGPDFKVESVRCFSLFCPPMYMQGFARRFPRLTKLLMRFDEAFGQLPVLNNWGDFFILTARYSPPHP